MSGPESRHERQLLLLGLLAPLPAVTLAVVLLVRTDVRNPARWLLAAVVAGAWLWGVLAARERVARTLATVSSLLTALRQGDFSVRAHESGGDALGADSAGRLKEIDVPVVGDEVRPNHFPATQRREEHRAEAD